ncbi:MerR family transcriptional regulator [Nocardioides stalactiti]|uniref:MerR family transcriptional regulator n=1 Tax=Nocardioides stalactiti TaxID=2755356 RepID=UPI0016012C6C|nr:MerR family transcriptional regulator [Nocardioides stalactiti]
MSTEGVSTDDMLTIDDLASAASTSVRTARYYASLGLLPPPMRHGRHAYYDERHLAGLQLIRALQEHGFSLAEIQDYLERMPEEASAEDLVIQRVMLSPWASHRPESVTRAELERRVGRRLSEEDVRWLAEMRAIEVTDEGFDLLMTFSITAQLLDLDLPIRAVRDADAAIVRHISALVDDLTEVVRHQVLAPFRAEPRSDAERDRFEHSLTKLRQLTLEALVASFQRASNEAIVRALGADGSGTARRGG